MRTRTRPGATQQTGDSSAGVRGVAAAFWCCRFPRAAALRPDRDRLAVAPAFLLAAFLLAVLDAAGGGVPGAVGAAAVTRAALLDRRVGIEMPTLPDPPPVP